jgi:hypothetical protein
MQQWQFAASPVTGAQQSQRSDEQRPEKATPADAGVVGGESYYYECCIDVM